MKVRVEEVMEKARSLREILADIEHRRWAGWQRYCHGWCTKNPDGTLTIPKISVDLWERKIATAYADLTEKEKESDRVEVDKYLPIIAQAIQEAKAEERGKSYRRGLREGIKNKCKLIEDCKKEWIEESAKVADQKDRGM